MSEAIIGKKARNELQQYFVGTTLREIKMEFDAADVPLDEDYNAFLRSEIPIRSIPCYEFGHGMLHPLY